MPIRSARANAKSWLKSESRVAKNLRSLAIVVGVIGAVGAVAVSGDVERIADHSWDVKFILPDNENIFRSII